MMRCASLLLLSVALSTGVASATVTNPVASADAAPLNAQFNVTSSTQIPGATLKPGKYTITIKDHLTDRLILQISDGNGKVETTFLGVFRDEIPGAGSQGPIAASGEKPVSALLGYVFPGGRSVQFVYPKAEAAALTTKVSSEILAVDPASDNLKSGGAKLSKEDAQIVTLWSLQVQSMAGGQKGVAAKRYVATTARPAQVQPNTTETASTSVAAKRPAPRAEAMSAASRVPAIKALPRTASNAPLLLLVSIGGLCLAYILNVKRRLLHAR